MADHKVEIVCRIILADKAVAMVLDETSISLELLKDLMSQVDENWTIEEIVADYILDNESPVLEVLQVNINEVEDE